MGRLPLCAVRQERPGPDLQGRQRRGTAPQRRTGAAQGRGPGQLDPPAVPLTLHRGPCPHTAGASCRPWPPACRLVAEVYMKSKDLLGRHGEDLAAGLLEALGMLVVERNWRCSEGEIDIVALD